MHYLDVNRDADPPPGTVVVDTEVEFLRRATSGGSLLVRGESLCGWARAVWNIRQVDYQEIASPRDQIMSSSFGTTGAEASLIATRWKSDLSNLSRPWSARSILDAIFPADFWQEAPGQRHAAKFVTWLSINAPDPCFAKMIRNVSIGWAQSATADEAKLYEASTSEFARRLLRQWLRIDADASGAPIAVFPLPVPAEFRAEAEKAWSLRVIASEGRFFDDLRQQPVPKVLLELAANITAKFFENNPAALAEQQLRSLQPYLRRDQFETLRALVPRHAPQDPPCAPDEMFPWFVDGYLPYRQWAEATQSADAISHSNIVARKFSEWYLGFYPQAIGRGDKNINFIRSGDIHARGRTGVTFLVILDGLNYPDGEVLKTRLVDHSARIGIKRMDFAFTAVPTITEVCKRALVYGITPRMAMEGATPSLGSGILLPENTDPLLALQGAKNGDLFVWRIIEPDKTYHSKGDRSTITKKVSSLLDNLAARIADAVMAVPDELKLHGIITSDHGRLLGKSVRALKPPASMSSHQRAALGPGASTAAAVATYEEGAAAYALLDGPRFELSDHCAVALTDHCFLAGDGRTGTERFAHGGLFPEEVIVPWIEFGRDLQTPSVVAELRGKAKENTEGVMQVVIRNPGDFPLVVVVIDLHFGSLLSQQIPTNERVGPWDTKPISIPFKQWPTTEQISAASARVTLRTPGGEEFTIAATIALESEGFYVRRDILGDLS